MKVAKKAAVSVKQSKKKQSVREPGNSYGSLRDAFVAMKPVNLRKLGVVGTRSHRPYMSGIASQTGIHYISALIPGSEGEIVFIPVIEE